MTALVFPSDSSSPSVSILLACLLMMGPTSSATRLVKKHTLSRTTTLTYHMKKQYSSLNSDIREKIFIHKFMKSKDLVKLRLIKKVFNTTRVLNISHRSSSKHHQPPPPPPPPQVQFLYFTLIKFKRHLFYGL